MRDKLKGLIAGVVIGAVCSAGTAYAAGITLRDVVFNNIKIVVDGQEIHPVDGQGSPVEPFIYSGTTYLPVRAVAEALGKEVYWDGPNYTVYLGKMSGVLAYPTLRFHEAVNIGDKLRELKNPVDNYGNSYSYAYGYDFYLNNTYHTLLNMKYSKFKGSVFVERGSTKDEVTTFKIEVDGKVVYTSPEITKAASPIELDVNVTGGNEFKIIITADYDSPRIYFGDAGFYQ